MDTYIHIHNYLYTYVGPNTNIFPVIGPNPNPMSLLITRSLKCEKKTNQELPRGKVLKEFPLTMVGISREEDLGICSCFCFCVFIFQVLEQGQGKFGVFFEQKLVVGSADGVDRWCLRPSFWDFRTSEVLVWVLPFGLRKFYNKGAAFKIAVSPSFECVETSTFRWWFLFYFSSLIYFQVL